jgi:hypothetical protein
MTAQAILFLIGCIALSILFIVTLVVGIRERGKLRARLANLAGQLAQKEAHLARAQEELRRATTRTVPMKDEGNLSMARALRKITGPVKPTSARTSTTSRQDPSTDTLNGMAMGSLVAPGGWSTPDQSPAPAPSPAPDCSPAPSVDSGACGGGE